VTTSTAGNDTSYYRKDNAGNFYTYVDTAGLSQVGVTFNQAFLDVLFLKETLTTGTVFNSDHPASFMGIPGTLRFKYTVENASGSLTVGSNTFSPNVYQIRLDLQFGTLAGFNDVGLPPVTFYYARNVGLVRMNDGTTNQDIRFWQIL
jgi:hypothetical protein